MKISEQSVHGKEPYSALIHLVPDRRFKPLCHHCGSPATTVHSKGHRRFIRDLNMASAQVCLQVAYRKIWCDHCQGVRVERLEFADAGKRVTHRLARYVHELCRVMTVQDVADHLDLDPRTVKAIDKQYLLEAFSLPDTTDLRVLLIDEIAIRKGHNYMTVIADYFTGRIVWMGPGRDKKTLGRFFATLNAEQKQAIEAVAMDMWDPYINRVGFHCPQAKIVFDFFHLVQAFGKVIDKVRRREYRKATEAGKKVLKGSRFVLLKNEANLTPDQRTKLQEVLALNTALTTLYVLKDHLKLLYYYSDRDTVRAVLEDWCDMAETVAHLEVQGFVRRLRRHAYGILNHADYPIGTSTLEGMNNKIKLIKRKAYGFHDIEYFVLKVKQAFAA
ncbi:MAG: ISL3 family transposase [Deltaproteobacteria bacterium]|nr:ISL3 family transposase [Deltaproteobacteria bacterium]